MTEGGLRQQRFPGHLFYKCEYYSGILRNLALIYPILMNAVIFNLGNFGEPLLGKFDCVSSLFFVTKDLEYIYL